MQKLLYLTKKLSMKNSEILISVIVCCFNEKDYIKRCINSLQNQKKINGEIEILVIDGLSNDGTREIITSLQKEDNRIKLFDNKYRVKPPAINLGFRESSGNYIAICDAHAYYDENYLFESLKILQSSPDIWCAGGPFINIGETDFGKANAIAMNSFIGIGNANHRKPNYEGFGEMVMFGLFPRSVLKNVGYYDEFFIINHDDEYCYRLRKAGGKVYITKKAKCYYFVRKTPIKLFKQYFSYGLWQIAFLKKHKIPISFRQLVPFSFFLNVIILLVAGYVLKNPFIAFLLPLTYIFTLFSLTIPVLIKNKFMVGLNFPLAVFILHFAYASGFFSGFFKFFRKKFD